MEYISSDTNVWIDFNTIDELDLPFKLNVTYIMYEEAIDNELLQPSWFKDKLIELGLVGVDITVEEFFMQMSLELSTQGYQHMTVLRYQSQKTEIYS